jgi:hypothetical protein
LFWFIELAAFPAPSQAALGLGTGAATFLNLNVARRCELPLWDYCHAYRQMAERACNARMQLVLIDMHALKARESSDAAPDEGFV